MRLCPALLLCCVPSAADELNLLDRDWFTLQPGEPVAPPAPAAPAAPLEFGLKGQCWLTFTAGGGADFDEVNFISPIAVSWSKFLDRNFEWILEGSLWYFDTTDEDSVGAAAIMSFRWHAFNCDRWSIFGEAGIGLSGQTDDVPPDGTEYNFAPRAGVGLTHRLGEGPSRAVVGLRWQHLSNGHLQGDDRNPAMDGAMLYFGLMWPLD